MVQASTMFILQTCNVMELKISSCLAFMILIHQSVIIVMMLVCVVMGTCVSKIVHNQIIIMQPCRRC